MHCKEKFKLSSHNTSDCLIEVDTKAGLTVYGVRVIPCRHLSYTCAVYLMLHICIRDILCNRIYYTNEKDHKYRLMNEMSWRF
jgi:hypothetical protein